jgi:ABC-2 type transport system permease protein
MDGLKALSRLQIWILKNSIARIKSEPKLKVFFISIAIIFFWFGSLALFYRGLSFFNGFPIIGPALVDESIYIFTAILFFMLALSGIIICYVTYYTTEEVAFLFSKPIDTRTIFFSRFLQSVVFGSWAFLFLGVTFILAYALIKNVPFWFYLFIPFYSAIFVLFPAALASIVVLTAVRFIDYSKVKYFLAAALCIGVCLVFWYYKKNIGDIIFTQTEIGYFLDNFLHHLRIFKYPLFPGYWMAASLVNSSTGNFTGGLFYFYAFTATTLLLLQVNWFLAGETFFLGWLSSRGGKNNKYQAPDRGLLNRLAGSLLFMPRSTAAMITKDIKLFIRDFGQWSQFLIYFAILGIYIFNLKNMPQASGNEYWKMIVTFLNLSATALVLAGFSVRFLYPLISLEGNKFWILGLAPITFKGLIIQKFIVNFMGILLVSEVLMIATNAILKTETSLFYISCGLACMVSIGLVGLSIGLGTIFPNFKEDNSAKIVSGFGGTLNFVIALIYVSILIIIFAVPYFDFVIHKSIPKHTFHLVLTVSWIISIIITTIVGILPMILGYKNLENMDF